MSSRSTLRAKGVAATVVLVATVIAVGGLGAAEPGFTPIQAMPVPAASGPINTFSYASLVCTSATTCEAVGPPATTDHPADVAQPPAATTETAGVWSPPTPIALPAGAAAKSTLWPGLQSLSCSDAGDCTAVGGYATTSAGATAAMAASQTSGTWGAATAVPQPVGAATGASERDVLDRVQCTSVGNCVAAGSDRGTDGLLHAYVETESAGSWSAGTELPDISLLNAKDPYRTTSLVCTDLTDCTVVGVVPGVTGGTYAWTETAGTWSDPVNVAPHSPGFEGNDLACPDPTTCILVGAQLFDGAYVTETSGVWSSVTVVPAPRLSPVGLIGALNAITCNTDALCEVTGEWLSIGGAAVLETIAGAATWSNGTWSSFGYVRTPQPKDAILAVGALNDVACPTTTACEAIGFSASLSFVAISAEAFSTSITPMRAVVAPRAPSFAGGAGIPDGIRGLWLPPTDDGGAPVTTFTATVEPGGRTCTTAGYACTFHGLANGHRYHVVVRDRTSFGPSAPRVGLATAGLAPHAPAAVRLAVLHPSEVEASWHPAATLPGEPVRVYVVTLTGPHHLTERLATHGLTARFGGLRPGAYTVRVEARNASGLSRPSAPAHARLP